MARATHPKKEVEEALRHAERNDWRVEVGGAHAWGKIYCPYNDEECRCGEFCITSVWSTPKNPGNHARQLKRVVDNCTTHSKRQADSNEAAKDWTVEYSFTLKYQLAEQDANHDELVERLGAAGCDDALVGVGQPGRIALEFVREADSAEAALMSALADVKRAIPSAKLIEAGPDLVGLTDVADVVGVTRQNMRKLMLNHATSFPTPVHEGSTSVWHLAEVMSWLQSRGTYKVEPAGLDVALITMQVNLAKQVRQLRPKLRRELRTILA